MLGVSAVKIRLRWEPVRALTHDIPVLFDVEVRRQDLIFVSVNAAIAMRQKEGVKCLAACGRFEKRELSKGG